MALPEFYAPFIRQLNALGLDYFVTVLGQFARSLPPPFGMESPFFSVKQPLRWTKVSKPLILRQIFVAPFKKKSKKL